MWLKKVMFWKFIALQIKHGHQCMQTQLSKMHKLACFLHYFLPLLSPESM